VKQRWMQSEIDRLLASYAFYRPPLNSRSWSNVAEVFNRGIAKTKRWTKSELLIKFNQIRNGPPTGGGGGRSTSQETADKLVAFNHREADGSRLTPRELTWIKKLCTEANLETEKKDVAAAEEDEAAHEKHEAAQEEDKASEVEKKEPATSHSSEKIKALNYLPYEIKSLNHIIMKTRRQPEDWTDADLREYHKTVYASAAAEIKKIESDTTKRGARRRAMHGDRMTSTRTRASLQKKGKSFCAKLDKTIVDLSDDAVLLKDCTDNEGVQLNIENAAILSEEAEKILSRGKKKRKRAQDQMNECFKMIAGSIQKISDRRAPAGTPPRVKEASRRLRIIRELNLEGQEENKRKLTAVINEYLSSNF